MSDEKFAMSGTFAGLFGAVVENQPLDKALQEVGLSVAYAMRQFVAHQSSDVATEYAEELMGKQFSISRDKGSDLYLVKKVLCRRGDYESISAAVSSEDTDKFKVVKLIGSNPRIMAYKQDSFGLEAYLVSGETPIEAMRKTTAADPAFTVKAEYFNADLAKKIDTPLSNAVYQHTQEALEKLLEVLE